MLAEIAILHGPGPGLSGVKHRDSAGWVLLVGGEAHEVLLEGGGGLGSALGVESGDAEEGAEDVEEARWHGDVGFG
jgi:hypothetical protein